MANVIKRSTVVGVMAETTEGTPVVPSGATKYVPVRADFDMSPSFDVQENEELKNSIGGSKPIQGVENPTASLPMYLKASGSAGTAPDADELLEAAFGNEDIEANEYNTVASSTTSVVKVDSGEGANYRRGQALLVQHAANDWEIRPIKSISTDDLTVLFDLDNAPGTGVDLGRAVTYYPAQSGHQALTVWQYLGNGGAIQMMSGAKVTQLDINFTAGQLITADYSVEGLAYYFNPITITSSNDHLDVNEDGGGETQLTVTQKTYKDPLQLAQAIEDALNNGLTNTYTCTYSSTTGKFTITQSGGSSLSLLWDSGTNAANTIGDTIGFDTSADDSSATTYEGDNAVDFSAAHTPSFDSVDPISAKNLNCYLGGTSDNTCFQASTVSFSMSNERGVNESICAESGRSGSVISGRAVTVSVTALLDQYEAENFKRFRANDEVGFAVNFGTKSGNNWEKTKSGCLSILSGVISEFNLDENNGLFQLNMTITAFVNSSNEDEVALSFV